jgi:hypothetical protein
VEALSFEELEAHAEAFDADVAASSELDRFCSSSLWALPAARTLPPRGAPWVRRGAHGWLALARRDEPSVTVLSPLEAMWGLSCPLVGGGDDPVAIARVAEEAAAILDAEAPDALIALSGLFSGTTRLSLFARALGQDRALRVGPPTARRIASLAGGLDGFLARRSSGFRTALRRADRRASDEGIHFVAPPLDDIPSLYERILAIEARSWKGQDGVGFAHSEMRDFYADMLPRLHARGALRVLLALDWDRRDVGFIVGGLFGPPGAVTYRGLQFSFARGLERLALGNLLQLRMIERLCDEGVAEYDLGTDVEYKLRWGETVRESVMLIALPRRGKSR